jgi:prepilin-type processing-associated H-X9-DG protein
LHSQILQFIEQDNLYRSIDFNYAPETPGMGGVINFMPAWQNPGRINATACRTKVKIFLCPADGAPEPSDWPGQNNYYANQGLSFLCDLSDDLPSTLLPNEIPDGPFTYLSKKRMASIYDGTSQTAFFSEKMRGSGYPDIRTDMLTMPNQTSLNATYNTCRSLPTTATPLTSKQGYSWVMGEMCCSTYNHVAQPNDRTCAGIGFPGTMANMAMMVPPSSRHSGGGVNVCFGDGSVRFVSSNINLVTWRAYGSINRGEVISEN